jgi:hypothetical protein
VLSNSRLSCLPEEYRRSTGPETQGLNLVLEVMRRGDSPICMEKDNFFSQRGGGMGVGEPSSEKCEKCKRQREGPKQGSGAQFL